MKRRQLIRTAMVGLMGTICLLATSRPADAEPEWRRDGSMAVGDVQVSSAADLTELRGISQIKGDLVIINYAGADLRGLESLALVEGMVVIFGNPELTSLKGLGKLEMIDGLLSVTSNPKLVDLGGLTELRAVKAGFTVTDNPSLTALLPKGLRIGEPIRNRKGYLQISGNKKLGDAKAQAYAKSCTLEGAVFALGN